MLLNPSLHNDDCNRIGSRSGQPHCTPTSIRSKTRGNLTLSFGDDAKPKVAASGINNLPQFGLQTFQSTASNWPAAAFPGENVRNPARNRHGTFANGQLARKPDCEEGPPGIESMTLRGKSGQVFVGLCTGCRHTWPSVRDLNLTLS